MNEQKCRQLVRQRASDGWYDPNGRLLPCECCGRWQPFEFHHRKFRSRGGKGIPSNIVLLCRDCHRAATDERVHGTGLNVHSWEDAATVPVRVWYRPRPVLLADDGTVREIDGTDHKVDTG